MLIAPQNGRAKAAQQSGRFMVNYSIMVDTTELSALE